MCECKVICPFKDRCKLWNTLSCENCGNNAGKGNYWKPRFPPDPIITPTTIPWTPWYPDGTGVPYTPWYPDGTVPFGDYNLCFVQWTSTCTSKESEKTDN